MLEIFNKFDNEYTNQMSSNAIHIYFISTCSEAEITIILYNKQNRTLMDHHFINTAKKIINKLFVIVFVGIDVANLL
jgi:imidazoleglycerol phosphate dehydratase HisB